MLFLECSDIATKIVAPFTMFIHLLLTCYVVSSPAAKQQIQNVEVTSKHEEGKDAKNIYEKIQTVYTKRIQDQTEFNKLYETIIQELKNVWQCDKYITQLQEMMSCLYDCNEERKIDVETLKECLSRHGTILSKQGINTLEKNFFDLSYSALIDSIEYTYKILSY